MKSLSIAGEAGIRTMLFDDFAGVETERRFLKMKRER
jgi:hypothetical protein